MLMEADLPEDIEALRALALDQSRKLADVTVAKGEADAEIERLQWDCQDFRVRPGG